MSVPATITQIRTAIKAKLDTLIGANQLQEVYDYHNLEPQGYPAATFEPIDLDAEFLDTGTNERTYQFEVIVTIPFGGDQQKTRQEALDIILTNYELITNAFDEDWTLGGVLQRIDASNGGFGAVQGESGDSYFGRILLNCMTTKDI